MRWGQWTLWQGAAKDGKRLIGQRKDVVAAVLLQFGKLLQHADPVEQMADIHHDRHQKGRNQRCGRTQQIDAGILHRPGIDEQRHGCAM